MEVCTFTCCQRRKNGIGASSNGQDTMSEHTKQLIHNCYSPDYYSTIIVARFPDRHFFILLLYIFIGSDSAPANYNNSPTAITLTVVLISIPAPYNLHSYTLIFILDVKLVV